MDDHAPIPGFLYGRCLFMPTSFVSAGQLLQIAAIKHKLAQESMMVQVAEILRDK